MRSKRGRPRKTALITREDTPVVYTTPMSLQAVRENVLRERFNINRTVAELEALSDEIDATLAFLKAKRDRA